MEPCSLGRCLRDLLDNWRDPDGGKPHALDIVELIFGQSFSWIDCKAVEVRDR